MNLTRAMGAAFGVDPTRFEALVDAYESPGLVLPPADRLTLIERRHEEAGRGDADKEWLIAECKKLRTGIVTTLIPLTALGISVRWELADSVRKAIHSAIREGRRALGMDA